MKNTRITAKRTQDGAYILDSNLGDGWLPKSECPICQGLAPITYDKDQRRLYWGLDWFGCASSSCCMHWTNPNQPITNIEWRIE